MFSSYLYCVCGQGWDGRMRDTEREGVRNSITSKYVRAVVQTGNLSEILFCEVNIQKHFCRRAPFQLRCVKYHFVKFDF